MLANTSQLGARIHKFVKAPNTLAAGQRVSPKKRGSHGPSFEAFAELVDGSLLGPLKPGVTNLLDFLPS